MYRWGKLKWGAVDNEFPKILLQRRHKVSGSTVFISIETDNLVEVFGEIIPVIERLGMKIVRGYFSSERDGRSKITLEINSPYERHEDIELFINLVRDRFPYLQIKCEYGASGLSSFLSYVGQDALAQRMPLMNMVLKSFFQVLKKTWGVIANVFMYQTGVKTGEVFAKGLHYDTKEEDIAEILESLFKNWKLNDFIEDYDVQLDRAGFRISLYGMLGYDSRNADTPAYFVKGFISGLVSKMLEKKFEIDLKEDNTKIEYVVRFT